MSSYHEFSFREQRQIRHLIASAWATAQDTPDPTAVTPWVPTITIGSLLEKFSLPAPDAVSDTRARRLSRGILRVLSQRGILLIGPDWISDRAYYRWVVQRFLPLEIPVNTAPHRPQRFRFTDLEPTSVDSLFQPLQGFFTELVDLNIPPRRRRFTQPDTHLRYVRAWRQSHLGVNVEELRPVASYNCLADDRLVLEFALTYTATRENRSRTHHSGTGKACLACIDGEWRIAELRFSGFVLPR